MRFVIGHQSDRGLVRETNEDAFFVSDRCLAVADGMGGHRAGEVASKMAMDVLDALESMPSTDSGWRDLVVQINRTVLDAARLDRRYRGIGATLTLAHWWMWSWLSSTSGQPSLCRDWRSDKAADRGSLSCSDSCVGRHNH